MNSFYSKITNDVILFYLYRVYEQDAIMTECAMYMELRIFHRMEKWLCSLFKSIYSNISSRVSILCHKLKSVVISQKWRNNV